MTVLVKTTLAPETFIPAARQQVLALDPEQPIYEVRTLAEMRANSVAPQRVNLMLVGLFAAIALGLAVIGLYGVLVHAVCRRTREIGVRIALGAQRDDVLRLIVGQGMRLALVGVAIGLAGALALTRVLQNLLFEVQSNDPLTFMLTGLLLIGVTALACWLPARRAAKVDPMEALRYE
jgi:ABC-type antimicrobial peptide transport system permease subunit